MIQSANEAVDFVAAIHALKADDPFACRIISLYHCYPPQLVFVDYWPFSINETIVHHAVSKLRREQISSIINDSFQL